MPDPMVQTACYSDDKSRLLLKALALGVLAAAGLWGGAARADTIQAPQLSWQELTPAPKTTPNNTYYNSRRTDTTSGTYKMPSAVSHYMSGAKTTSGGTSAGSRTGAKKKECPELTPAGDQLKTFNRPNSGY